jgi:parvulin-like peptidyl-prolyl isomerase
MRVKKLATKYGIALIAAVVVLCAGCRSADSTPTIVTINGDKIRKSEFDRFLKTKLGELSSGDTSDALKSQMLDEFVVRKLVLAAATSAGLSVSESEIKQTAEDPQMKSSTATEDARKELANDLLVSKYYRQVVLKDVRVSPEEVQRYIDENRAKSVEKPGFYVREIQVETKEEADRLWHEVVEQGRDFASVVRQYSQVPNAEQGGLSHYIDGQLPEVLENAVKLLRPGDISPVIQSSFGYHIFKLERRTQPRPDDERRSRLDEDRSRLIEDVIERKNQQAVDQAVDKMVSQAAIKIEESAAGFTYVGRLRHN